MRSTHAWDFWADLFSTATLTAFRSTISWRPMTIMSGAFWPLGPQPLQSHDSRDSSFPLAFTFQVPRKTRT